MQDLNQLIINTNAAFADSILGTVNSFIIYAGATRETANKLAGTQIYEIDDLLMSLKKPYNGHPPTAIYISKYPVFGKGGTEVYRLIPISSKQVINQQNTAKEPDNAFSIQVEPSEQTSNLSSEAPLIEEEKGAENLQAGDYL